MEEILNLQALYQGFCATPLLWKQDDIRGLHQLEITDFSLHFLRKLERPLRLGQLAERFVFNQMDTAEDFESIAENIQIQDGKQTVGELDALIKHHRSPIHLEIVYKFYLYDASLGSNTIVRWIGPNRKDSFSEKLDKLSQKQLPLLHTDTCQPVLRQLGLEAQQLEQRVLFKAQLFAPYGEQVDFEKLNPKALKGFYLHRNQLQHFKASKFYIPKKLDWFLDPIADVIWSSWQTFISTVDLLLENHRAPMIWIKDETGTLHKVFLVWW
ncbi:DUF1853 family protein [Sediminibacter sp. Hel_I_10]|uniref:DUF1853 family protein n=1 Tax=Sediminibacter sp. Hel_I_10 TaxID=1392490 RepID=UPI00047CCE3D|nr:DUF1853 family protein [Sediminibacter sp. Hel_I_10]